MCGSDGGGGEGGMVWSWDGVDGGGGGGTTERRAGAAVVVGRRDVTVKCGSVCLVVVSVARVNDGDKQRPTSPAADSRRFYETSHTRKPG